MQTYTLRGVKVRFPFEAYQCQLIYMEKVIEALQNKENALLESPTGTGKTLCLLCATLAWREAEKERLLAQQRDNAPMDFAFAGDPDSGTTPPVLEAIQLPTIIYSSRTHSQLSQVTNELARTYYSPLSPHRTDPLNPAELTVCILGSRGQLCINPHVSTAQHHLVSRACRVARKQGKCHYYAPFDSKKSKLDSSPLHVADIDELKEWGMANQTCPYYMSKKLMKTADVIFMPYNYLVDGAIRKSLGANLDNAVVIIDEAHNIESVASDSSSFEITSLDLDACIDELTHCIEANFDNPIVMAPLQANLDANRVKAATQAQNGEEVQQNQANPPIIQHSNSESSLDGSVWDAPRLRDVIKSLRNAIMDMQVGSDGLTQDGGWIIDLFDKCNIRHELCEPIVNLLDRASEFLNNPPDGVLKVPSRSGQHLQMFSEAINRLFSDDVEEDQLSQNYKVFIKNEQKYARETVVPKNFRRLSFWCFNPGIAMNSIKKRGVRNFILTSGTLSPMDSFASELSLKFPIKLENPHVIADNQIWVGVMKKAPDGKTALNSSYESRSYDYIRGIGSSLVNLVRSVPDGMLVFFPSYKLLESAVKLWKTPISADGSCVWDGISKYKHPVTEPKESSKLQLAINDYVTKINECSESAASGVKTVKNGAIFFAVCRGKVSEGLDFADRNGRAVVVIGIPYPSAVDARVRLKKEYMDKVAARTKAGQTKPISGSQWYTQSAWRAVNQAVGRVIRHRADYGAIILADERFQGGAVQNLSLWLRRKVETFPEPGPAFKSLREFFKTKTDKPISPLPTKPIPQGEQYDIQQRISAANLADEQQMRDASRAALVAATTSTTDFSPKIKRVKEGEPAPTRRAKVEVLQSKGQHRPKVSPTQYLADVKSKTPRSVYVNFQGLLRSYRQRTLSKEDLGAKVIELFVQTQSNLEFATFAEQLTVFLPSNAVQQYKDKLELAVAEKKSLLAGGSVLELANQLIRQPGAEEPNGELDATPNEGANGDVVNLEPVPKAAATSAEVESSPPIVKTTPPGGEDAPRGLSPRTPSGHRMVVLDSDEEAKDKGEEESPQPRPAPKLLFQTASSIDSVPDRFGTADEMQIEPPTSPTSPLGVATARTPSPASTTRSPQAITTPLGVTSPSSTRRKAPSPNAIAEEPIEGEDEEEVVPVPPPKYISLSDEEEDLQPKVVPISLDEDLDDIPEPVLAGNRTPGTPSRWVQNLNRKRPASAQTGALVEATPPKRVKRTPSYDLITGQQVDPKSSPRIAIAAQNQVIQKRIRAQETSPPGPSSLSTTSLRPFDIWPTAQGQISPPAAAAVPQATSPPGRECGVCKSDYAEPHSAKCGHILCLQCWKQCLAIKLECPICKQRTREKQLTKLFL